MPSADLRLIAFVTLIASLAAVPLAEQSPTISTAGGVLRVQAPGFGVIEGDVLDRLRDGRSLRLDFELAVLAEPAGSAVTKARQSFNLSYDLWEERFAVARIGTPPRSVSHLRLKESEAWCLDYLTVPLTELRRFGPSSPFWLRLEYRVPEEISTPESDGSASFSLRNLIDALSRKRRDSQVGKSLQAGPFRLSS